jgi:predicted nucleic acid-binding protein
MIVVDVNVVVYCFIEGQRTVAARKLRTLDADWRLPDLWRHEYLNILATWSRQGGASLADTQILWRNTVRLLAPCEQPVNMESALALACEHNISAYDAQYVALAQRLRTRLVTEDRRLLRAFPDLAVTMDSYL